MIKKDVSYVDFDEKAQTDTLWFHVSKSRLTDHMSELKADIDAVDSIVQGDKRDLSIPEAQRVLDLIKKMVRLSYGVRSEDGKRFRQTEQDWEDFRYSAVYDKLLTDFMENPASAMTFLEEIMPKDLVEQAKQQIEQGGPVQGITMPQETVATPNPLAGLSSEQIAELVAQAEQAKGHSFVKPLGN